MYDGRSWWALGTASRFKKAQYKELNSNKKPLKYTFLEIYFRDELAQNGQVF